MGHLSFGRDITLWLLLGAAPSISSVDWWLTHQQKSDSYNNWTIWETCSQVWCRLCMENTAIMCSVMCVRFARTQTKGDSFRDLDSTSWSVVWLSHEWLATGYFALQKLFKCWICGNTCSLNVSLQMFCLIQRRIRIAERSLHTVTYCSHTGTLL